MATEAASPNADRYEHEETRALVALVHDASDLVRARGEAAFEELASEGSRWRQGERYIFVLDPAGPMLVHPDPELVGRNTLALKDINGRPIIRGLIDAATGSPDKPEGWYHYQWPVPGGLLPRWKSSYVRLVAAPSGQRYLVGSGVYNDRMERAFVVHAVRDASARLAQAGEAAFAQLRDPTGPFIAKDAYVFVLDLHGVALVHPAFPYLEGRDLSEVRDTQGKYLVREILARAREDEAGWVDYMWPKPGESVSTQKSTYVEKARLGEREVVVACGVYLADAPKEVPISPRLSASELTALVREGAAEFEQRGEQAYPEFRERGSRWFRDETYFFVWTMDGTRVFHAANPASEGDHVADAKDVVGRPFGRMILAAGARPSGEGWLHYMYPQPDNLFPTWKSSFVKRVTFPSGVPHMVGCGVYNMQMDKAFIEDVVDQAAQLVSELGRDAFPRLRDKTGPFVFFDTFVFVDSPDGTEWVNPAQPSLEGRNILQLRDLHGKACVEEYIGAALAQGSAWVAYHWYRPGSNTPARKQAYVRTVEAAGETFIVGSGIYAD